MSIIKGRCTNQGQVCQSSMAGVPIIKGRCISHQWQVCQSSRVGVPIKVCQSSKAGVSIINGRCANHQWQVYQSSRAGVPITAALCNSLEYFDMSTLLCILKDQCVLCAGKPLASLNKEYLRHTCVCVCVCLSVTVLVYLLVSVCVCLCAHVEAHTCQIYRLVLYDRLDECSVLCCMALSG